MLLKWINTAAFAAMVLVNALANLIPLGGRTTGQVSEAYPSLFTPAPFTFAIWGVIYALLALFIIYQWEVFDHGARSARVRTGIGPWFAAGCAANILWILFWHGDSIGWALICIGALLFTLIMVQKRLDSAKDSLWGRIAADTAFSLYYGWIIAATISNACVFLVSLGWNGWGIPAGFWTCAVLLIGAAITFMVIRKGKSFIPGIGVMWAYAGILFRHISPAYLDGAHPYVIAAGVLSELIILAAILLPGRFFTALCPGKKTRADNI